MANTRSWSVIAAASAALLLSACGGDVTLGGGTTGGTLGGTTGGDPTDPVPTTLILLASSPTLTSDAEDVSAGVILTAIVRDANNNVVPNVTVVFATQDSAEINVVNPAITDANGRVQAILTTGGDPENRVVTVTATTQTTPALARSVQIGILGTTLTISGADTTQFGTPTEYTILLADASSQGVAGQTIQLATEAQNSLSAATLVTDGSGQVKATLTVEREESTLTATALGLSATQEISASPDQFVFVNATENCALPLDAVDRTVNTEVDIEGAQAVVLCWLQNDAPVRNQTINFAATRGTIDPAATTDARGRVSVVLQSNEAGFSTITASSQALTKPSNSRTVEFVATNPARIDVQAGPATIPPNQSSEITAVVRDANNNLVKNVTVEFSLNDLTSGTLSSPTAVTNSQGLARVNYTSTSQTSASEGVTITGRVRGTSPVVQDIATLTVGGRAVGIVLGTGSEIGVKDESTYQMNYTVVVSDSAGNPVPNAQFRLTVAPTLYFEGTFGSTTGVCPNEDVNLNDILDVSLGEDLNGNGRLEPGRVATLPATIQLDADGSGQFQLTYPKDYGRFVEVLITATATVAGSETTVRRFFTLPVAEDEVDNLPGVSPFGADGNCGTYDPAIVTP